MVLPVRPWRKFHPLTCFPMDLQGMLVFWPWGLFGFWPGEAAADGCSSAWGVLANGTD